jgi:hypothetical protein
MKKWKNWPENHPFFDENHRFLKVFEITRTSSSLVLRFFKRLRTNSSLVLEWFWNIQRARTCRSLKI